MGVGWQTGDFEFRVPALARVRVSVQNRVLGRWRRRRRLTVVFVVNIAFVVASGAKPTGEHSSRLASLPAEFSWRQGQLTGALASDSGRAISEAERKVCA